MEEQRSNIPTPPPNMRRVPPPPPGVQRPVQQEVSQVKPVEEEKKEELVEQNTGNFAENQSVAEEQISQENIKKEKVKKDRSGSKAGLLYWGGFILSIGLIAFCIFMLVR